MSSLKCPMPLWSGRPLPPSAPPPPSPNPFPSRMGPNSDFRREREGKREGGREGGREGIVGRQTRTSAEFTCETTAAAHRGVVWNGAFQNRSPPFLSRARGPRQLFEELVLSIQSPGVSNFVASITRNHAILEGLLADLTP